jgi:Transcriptional regulators
MPKEYKLQDSLGYQISKTKTLLQISFTKEIRNNNLTASVEQWSLLHLIKTSPGLTQSDIASKTMKDKTNITRMLDVLEKNRCIERKNDSADRRAYHIYITQQGINLLEKLIPLSHKVNNSAVKGVKKSELIVFLKVLNQIQNNFMD